MQTIKVDRIARDKGEILDFGDKNAEIKTSNDNFDCDNCSA